MICCPGPTGPTGGPSTSALSVNRIDLGNVGGSKLVDIDTTSLPDGSLATVWSVGRQFYLEKAPSAALIARAADPTQGGGIVVVASTATPGSIWCWVTGTTDTRFASNPPGWIDPTLGNDDNDGSGPGVDALKSADEWCRRMNGAVIASAFTVQCAAGVCGDVGALNLGIATGDTAFSLFIGSRSLSVAGAVSSIVPQNSLTQTEFQFTDSSGTGPVIADGDMLVIVSSAVGANVGAIGYVKGFAAGGATNPYTSTWVNPSLAAVFPQAGDTYAVVTLLSTITGIDIDIENDDPALNGNIGIQSFNLGSTRGNSYRIKSNCIPLDYNGTASFGSYLQWCKIDDTVESQFQYCDFRAFGCDFKKPVQLFSTQFGCRTNTFRGALTIGTGCFVNFVLGSSCFDGPSASLLCGAGSASIQADLCFSRNTSAQGVLVQGTAECGMGFVTNNTCFWSPPLGARNAIVIGVVLYAQGQISGNTAYTSASQKMSGSFAAIALNNIPINQDAVNELTGAKVSDYSTTGEGGVAFLRNSALVPAGNPTTGTHRFSFGGHQEARSSGGMISTVVPVGAAAAGHAQLVGTRYANGPFNTVNVATTNIVGVPAMTASGVTPAAIDNCGFTAVGTLTGIDAANNIISIRVSRTFRRIAGVLTARGTATTVWTTGDAALLATTGDLVVSGTAITLTATGVAATTIAWCGEIELFSTDFVG